MPHVYNKGKKALRGWGEKGRKKVRDASLLPSHIPFSFIVLRVFSLLFILSIEQQQCQSAEFENRNGEWTIAYFYY